jgi:hypothetical protein
MLKQDIYFSECMSVFLEFYVNIWDMRALALFNQCKKHYKSVSMAVFRGDGSSSFNQLLDAAQRKRVKQWMKENPPGIHRQFSSGAVWAYDAALLISFSTPATTEDMPSQPSQAHFCCQMSFDWGESGDPALSATLRVTKAACGR